VGWGGVGWGGKSGFSTCMEGNAPLTLSLRPASPSTAGGSATGLVPLKMLSCAMLPQPAGWTGRSPKGPNGPMSRMLSLPVTPVVPSWIPAVSRPWCTTPRRQAYTAGRMAGLPASPRQVCRAMHMGSGQRAAGKGGPNVAAVCYHTTWLAGGTHLRASPAAMHTHTHTACGAGAVWRRALVCWRTGWSRADTCVC